MVLTTLSSSSDPETSTRLPMPSSSDVSRKYDVFLNFRGEDTRRNIMGHLRDNLSEKGIKTFVDDDRLERGHFISPQLLQAIESSSCAIVLLSPNYAFSKWCLDELVKILDCMKNRGQTVIPIFYHVEPSDVRKQTGKFGEAMAQHEMHLKENLERVNNWRVALTELTNLAGFDFKNYGDEARFVREIVEDLKFRIRGQRQIRSHILVVGPCGGSGGSAWDDGIYTAIRKINLRCGLTIHSIQVDYDVNGTLFSGPAHGGSGGENVTIELGPDEYIKSVSGYTCPLGLVGYISSFSTDIVRSLTFTTNLRTCGPYGTEYGKPFSLPIKEGFVVGFTGSSGLLLDAIGVRLSL